MDISLVENGANLKDLFICREQNPPKRDYPAIDSNLRLFIKNSRGIPPA